MNVVNSSGVSCGQKVINSWIIVSLNYKEKSVSFTVLFKIPSDRTCFCSFIRSYFFDNNIAFIHKKQLERGMK